MTFFLVLNQNLENIRLAVKLNYCNFATEILHLTYFHLKQTVKSHHLSTPTSLEAAVSMISSCG